MHDVFRSFMATGDIKALSQERKVSMYETICKSLGLNPMMQPLQIINFKGREILYPTRTATDQLAAINNLNREIIEGPKLIEVDGCKMLYAKCKAVLPSGRFETAVATIPLRDVVNGFMHVETKAKRRATLSLLGLLDEDVLAIEDKLPSDYHQTIAIPNGIGETKESDDHQYESSDDGEDQPEDPFLTELTIAVAACPHDDINGVAKIWADNSSKILTFCHGDGEKVYDLMTKFLAHFDRTISSDRFNRYVEMNKWIANNPEEEYVKFLFDKITKDKTLQEVVDSCVMAEGFMKKFSGTEDDKLILGKLIKRVITDVMVKIDASIKQPGVFIKDAMARRNALDAIRKENEAASHEKQ